jgi:hypothetical protein
MAATPSIPDGTVMPLNGLSCYFAEKQIIKISVDPHRGDSEEILLLSPFLSGLFQTLSFYPEDGAYTFLRNLSEILPNYTGLYSTAQYSSTKLIHVFSLKQRNHEVCRLLGCYALWFL